MNGKNLKTKVINFIAGPSCGKCHGIDTPILMYDGEIKMVQDILVGDMVMGDDSKPRLVSSLARGREMLYRVTCQNGDVFTVNESHILCLKYGKNKCMYFSKNKNRYIVEWFEALNKRSKSFDTKDEAECFKNDIDENKGIEISVKEYLQLNKTLQRNLKCYTQPVNFSEKDIMLNPYLLGAWLGDGTSNMSQITCQDARILKYFPNNLSAYNCYLDYRRNYAYTIDTIDFYGKSKNYRTKQNMFRELLIRYNLIQNKHIPYEYKCNTRRVRLQVLAGLIDTDGYYIGNSYEITQKSKILTEDIMYLCKSLGFFVSINRCEKYCLYKGEKRKGWYYRIYISGNGLHEIPVLCVRKKALEHTYSRDLSSLCLLNFKVEELGENDYYGFTVDKNHRYLLGNFVVSHNSTISSLVFAELKMMHKSAEIVPEVAKWLIYRDQIEKLNDQYYISVEQYKQIKAIYGKVEYIIGDSGILTGLYYNRAYASNMSDVKKTEKMILERNAEFDNIYIYIERNPKFEFEKEGRVHTEEQSKRIDIELKEMMEELKIPYKSFLSDRESVLDIVKYILNKSNV
jgi:hypothetical protein